ncbi:MAG: hypothetical protein VB089_20365, partial [Anaerolineaceae bacterium]|nr:hypothetical protein [Anaerolineaceae bacterium]
HFVPPDTAISQKNLFSPSARRFWPRRGGRGEWQKSANASGNLDAFTLFESAAGLDNRADVG